MIVTGFVSYAICNESGLDESFLPESAALTVPKNHKNHHYAEYVSYDSSLDPVTHLSMKKEFVTSSDKRLRRTPEGSTFDRGYDEFLRNYYRDNGHHDEYKVKESNEDQSESNDRTDDDSDDDNSNGANSGESSDESEADHSVSEEQPSKTKKSYSKVKNDKQRKKNDSNEEREKKKKKHCRIEKRNGMTCNVCYNPKNDESTELCKSSSDPKGKKYAYSKEKKYSHSDGDKQSESFEDNREFTTRQPPGGPFNNNNNINNNNNNNRFHYQQQQPPIHFRRNPQLPSNFPRQNPYTIIRYRPGVGPIPGRSQRIRIYTIPGPPPPPIVAQMQNQMLFPPNFAYNNNRLPPFPSFPETRPQRDTATWVRLIRPYAEGLTGVTNNKTNEEIIVKDESSVIKPEHSFSINQNNSASEITGWIPVTGPPIDGISSGPFDRDNSIERRKESVSSRLNSSPEVDREYADFISKDWSKCRRYLEGDLVCYECGNNIKNSNRECMMAAQSKPDEYRSRQTYAKSNSYDQRERNEPKKLRSGRRRAKIHPAWQTVQPNDDIISSRSARARILPIPLIPLSAEHERKTIMKPVNQTTSNKSNHAETYRSPKTVTKLYTVHSNEHRNNITKSN